MNRGIRRNRKIKKTLLVGLAAGLGVGLIFSAVMVNREKGRSETIQSRLETENSKMQSQNKKLKQKAKESVDVQVVSAETLQGQDANWEMVLVNDTHPLDTQYTPTLVDVAENKAVDSRIVDDTNQMLDDAKNAGLSMIVCSAYRSYDDQKGVFNETMQTWINQGMSYVDAYDETKKSVAVPGTSEHATGLALDITSSQYQELDDKQADTAEAKWLAENCYKYGFVLRYPVNKAEVTGIVYEPWHYRYVGKDNAKKITDEGLTLEEYLAQQ